MFRKIGLLVLFAGILLTTLQIGQTPATLAQDGSNAATLYQLNMRTGPGTNYDIVTTLESNTPLVLEGRNEDTSWVLGHTVDGAFRGWLASLYLSYEAGFSATQLPVTGEIVASGAAPAPAADVPDDSAPEPAASAPGGVTAYTNYQMNVRSGPGTNHDTLGTIDGGVGLVLEARNQDASWVLAHTQDGTMRGWLASLYLNFVGVTATSLPYSDETLTTPGPLSPTGPTTNVDYNGIPMGGYDPARIEDIDLAAFPIVGRSTARARQIFLEGQAQGRNPHVLTKVGDCSSEHWYFLSAFAWGEYNLGSYGDLQPVINHFGDSLAVGSEATHNGFNVNTVGAHEWANPGACQPGESPLLCEYRISNPSVSIIMFGTSDLLVMTPYEFDFYMRIIVDQTIEQGIIPVLSTFPGNLNFWGRTIIYNQIVVRIALDYDIPLINLWLALESLPNKGLEPDGFHLGEPLTAPGDLTGANLQTGYPTRNLVTLQTLNNIWRSAMQ